MSSEMPFETSFLVWSCEGTLAERNRIGVTVPVNRCEGRLLAMVVPEFPLPPLVVDHDGYIDQLAALFQQRLTSSGHLLVATDGSVVDAVAAGAVVLDDADCSLGVDAEDQTPHRAEVEALYAVYCALSKCSAHGTVDILSDCKAVMLVSNGLGVTKVLAQRFLALKHAMQHRIAVTSWWVGGLHLHVAKLWHVLGMQERIGWLVTRPRPLPMALCVSSALKIAQWLCSC